jgi:hypothetical protein
MDEHTNVLVQTLKERMDREAELFTDLGREMERLRDSFHGREWDASLEIAGGLDRSARRIEAADADRDEAFASLKSALDMPEESTLSALLPELPDAERLALETSWRGMRMSVARLKTATGRMRYAAEAMTDTFNRILEQVFPYRKGKIYSRRGTPTAAGSAHIIDHSL